MAVFCASLSRVSVSRARLSAPTHQVVSFMPSGSISISRSSTSRFFFVTRSSSKPSTSTEIEYSQNVPGWCASGIVPRFLSMSPAVMSFSSASMFRSSYSFLMRGERVLPPYTKPAVWRSRSCTVTARVGATSPAAVSTFRSFSSGSQFDIGSLSFMAPCSTSIMAATLTMGLVIDAILKIASFVIGLVLAASR